MTEAFREDPVRILRVARFAARFTDFSVAPETMAADARHGRAGEVDHLVPERVWQEISARADGGPALAHVRGAARVRRPGVLLPELDRLWGVPQRADYHPEVDTGVHAMLVLDMAAQLQAPLAVRFACLCHDLGKGTTPAECCRATSATNSAAPGCCRACASAGACPTIAANWPTWWRASTATSTAAGSCRPRPCCACWSAATRCASPSALPRRCWACECDARGRWGFEDCSLSAAGALEQALAVALGVATGPIAAGAVAAGEEGAAIGQAVDAVRVQALGQWLKTGESS